MKEALDKSAPEFEYFDHDLDETLLNILDIDADDEGNFFTSSENLNTIIPSQLSPVLKIH